MSWLIEHNHPLPVHLLQHDWRGRPLVRGVDNGIPPFPETCTLGHDLGITTKSPGHGAHRRVTSTERQRRLLAAEQISRTRIAQTLIKRHATNDTCKR